MHIYVICIYILIYSTEKKFDDEKVILYYPLICSSCGRAHGLDVAVSEFRTQT